MKEYQINFYYYTDLRHSVNVKAFNELTAFVKGYESLSLLGVGEWTTEKAFKITISRI